MLASSTWVGSTASYPTTSCPWGLLLGKARWSEFFLLGGTLGLEWEGPCRFQGAGWGTATDGTMKTSQLDSSGHHVHIIQQSSETKHSACTCWGSVEGPWRGIGMGWQRLPLDPTLQEGLWSHQSQVLKCFVVTAQW